MTKQDIINYVTTTPHNSNKAVLSTMLDSFGASDNKEEIELLAQENKVYTPAEGKVYNKVTVNVPAPPSDLTIATVTLICPEAILPQVGFTGAVCIESYSAMGRTEPLLFPMYSPSQMGVEAKVPLYKGCTVWTPMEIPAEHISVTGDITIETGGQGALLTITGNGTITITAD